MPNRGVTTLRSRGVRGIATTPPLMVARLSAFNPQDNGITGARFVLASLVM